MKAEKAQLSLSLSFSLSPKHTEKKRHIQLTYQFCGLNLFAVVISFFVVFSYVFTAGVILCVLIPYAYVVNIFQPVLYLHQFILNKNV